MEERESARSEFERLKEAWTAAHPKRAAGGLVSQLGFQLQIHSALRDAVRAWSRTRDSIDVLVEALSDIASPEPAGGWRITQVKRTGSSSSLRKALEELWTVHQVALQETPSLAGRLVYEVRCGRWELKDVERVVTGWIPKSESDPAELDSFRAQVEATTDPHPRRELIELLVAETRAANPLAFIEQWTGKLLTPGADAPEELLSALTTLERAQAKLPAGIRMVPTDLAEPEEVERGEYLVGQQPRLSHVRKGFFAPREWQLEPAVAAVLEWMGSDPFGHDRNSRLPVFWITGRSGSGKSVLLLQVLARLSQAAIGPMVWLGNRHHVLAPALQWAVKACREGEQPIVCIDDPFAPGELGSAIGHWRAALDEVEALRDDGDRVPIILTCGPAEQLSGAEGELREDIAFESWRLDDRLDQEHVESLSRWFHDRTGHEPPVVGQGDVLMVQRFFEWRTGEPLAEFAARFRGRVKVLDSTGNLAPFLETLLAVNRLYAGLPGGASRALSARDRDSLEVLRRDHHIAIQAEGEAGRPGLWVGHPHLADALFNGWLPAERVNERADALLRGIVSCRQTGESPGEKTAPLWALWRAKTGGLDERVAERVDWPSTKRILEEAFRDEGESTPLSHLPAWIHLSMDVVPGALEPDPVRLGLDKLSPEAVEETGSRLTCHILLRHLDQMEEGLSHQVLDTIRSVLDGALDWREWPWVALDLVAHTEDERDGELLLRWIARHTNHPTVPTLLFAAVSLPSVSDPAIALAVDMAAAAGPERPWSRVYEAVLRNELSTDRLERVVDWAFRYQLEPWMPFVLVRLLELDHPYAVGLSREWLRANPTGPVANFVLEPLLKADPTDPELLGHAQQWARPSRVGADRLIEHLLTHGNRESAVSLATAWLDTNPDAKGWAHVLQTLLNTIADDGQRQAVVERATTWLEGREDQPAWSFVFQRLLEAFRDDEQLRALVAAGILWLEGREDRTEWAHVVQKLLDTARDDGQRQALIDAATHWLDGREEQTEWSFVLQKLLETVQDGDRRRALLTIAKSWLEGREDQPGWTYLLQKVLDTVADDEERRPLVETATRWLDGRQELTEWSFVLQKLLDYVDEDGQRQVLVEAAMRWLEGREEQPEWTHVLRKLLDCVNDEGQRQALIGTATRWLEGREELPQWSHVLRQLLDNVREENQRRVLVEVAMRWLDGGEDRPEWAHVLQKLLDTVQDGEVRRVLLEAALDWLDGREDRPEWAYLVQKLLDHIPEDGPRRAIVDHAFRWLEGRESKPEWAHVVQKLLDTDLQDDGQRQALIERATDWLVGREHQPEWSYVLQKLLDAVQDDDVRHTLIETAIGWLDGRDDQPEWSYVLQKLLDTVQDEEQCAAVVAAGTAWIAGRESRSEWSFVLQKLLDTVRADEQRSALVGAASSWLAGREEQPEWSYVLRKTLEEVRDDEQREGLIDASIPWLEGREDQPEWTYVLRALLDAVRDEGQRQSLVGTATAWLEGREDQPEWAFVFQQLLDTVQDDGQVHALVDVGLGWLAGREDRPEWNYVVQKLLGVARDQGQLEALVESATRWLDGREDLPSWNYVLQELLETIQDDERRSALIERALRWLPGRERHTAWNFVLQKLLDKVRDDGQRRSLVEAGTRWLAGRERLPAWNYVLRKLLETVEDEGQRHAIIGAGTRWLDGREDRPEWSFVLQRLLDEARNEEQFTTLTSISLAWVSARFGHPGSPHVLRRLFDRLSDADDRLALMEQAVAVWSEDRKDWPRVACAIIRCADLDAERDSLLSVAETVAATETASPGRARALVELRELLDAGD